MREFTEIKSIFPAEGMLLEGILFKDIRNVSDEIKEYGRQNIDQWKSDNATVYASLTESEQAVGFPHDVLLAPIPDYCIQVYPFLDDKLICIILLDKLSEDTYPPNSFCIRSFPMNDFISSIEYAKAELLMYEYLYSQKLADFIYKFSLFNKAVGDDVKILCNSSSGIPTCLGNRIPKDHVTVLATDTAKNRVFLKVESRRSEWTPGKFINFLTSWNPTTYGDSITFL